MEKAIKTAIEFMKEGKSFKVGSLRLGLQQPNGFYVTGWSSSSNLENLTKQSALSELQEIKHLFQTMLDVSPDLNEYVSNKCIEFNLAFDYGQGAVGVCSEKDGEIVWEI